MSTTEIPDAAVLLTIDQVAEITQLQPRTIRRYVSSGRFPSPCRPNDNKSSKGVRWVRAEVMAWVEQLKNNR
jgi:predicted DNA-binding transcriptional regulator AlpA